MIKVNLGGKKKKKSGSGPSFSLDLKGLDISKLFSFLKKNSQAQESMDTDKKRDLRNSPLVKAILGIVLAYVVEDSLVGMKKDKIDAIDKQVSKIETELSGVQAKLAKVKGFEEVKKQLEADERAIRTKLETINRLLENRNASAKLMMQVAQNIPEEVWLTEMKVNEESATFVGGTPGYSQVSDFINALNNSSQFMDINIKGIEENSSAAKDQKFQSFEIRARRRGAEKNGST
jgi:Tfp pilus assembly protein PilN